MAAIPYHVAESFKRQKKDKAGAFQSTGGRLYSYGLLIAHWEDRVIVFDLEPGHRDSVTTSRHLKAARAVLSVP